MNSSTLPAPTITTGEAAKRLGVKPPTIRRWCEQSGFGFRVGGHYRVLEARVAEIERRLLACGTVPTYGDARK